MKEVLATRFTESGSIGNPATKISSSSVPPSLGLCPHGPSGLLRLYPAAEPVLRTSELSPSRVHHILIRGHDGLQSWGGR